MADNAPAGGRQVWVAAFGKHPGWNDHIDDIGLDTEGLVAVKRALYLEGIGGNIDRGSWEELEGDARRDGFSHVFLWRRSDGFFVGRVWSSSDGKGRTRYPMIVCAQTKGVAADAVIREVMPELARAESACRGAATAAEVISIIGKSNASLRDRLNEIVSVPGHSGKQPPLAVLAADESIGTAGVHRVLYQLEREFSAYLRVADGEDPATRTLEVDMRPQQFRAPAVGQVPEESAMLWMKAALARLDVRTPMVAIASADRAWVDVVAGEPGRSQFFCLQAAPAALPSTTEIPYTIDDEHTARFAGLIARTDGLSKAELDPAVFPTPTRRASAASAVSTASAAGLPWKPIAIGVGAIVVLVTIAVVVLSGGGGSGGASVDETPAGEPERASTEDDSPATPAVRNDPELTEAFSAWCDASEDWLLALRDQVRRSPELFAGDAFVNDRVVTLLSEAATYELDPNKVVATPRRDRRSLGESPPSAVFAEPLRSSIIQTARAVRDLESAITGDAWPARRELAEIRAQTEKRGLNLQAEMIDEVLAAADPGRGARLGDGIIGVMAAAETLRPISDAIGRLDAGAETAARVDDAAIGRFPEVYDAAVRSLGKASSIEDMPRHAADLYVAADRADDLVAAEQAWSSVDQEVFGEFSESHARLTRGDSFDMASLRLWITEVRSGRFDTLEPSDDPRGGAKLAERIMQLKTDVDEVASLGEAVSQEELAELRASIAQLGPGLDELVAMRWDAVRREAIENSTASLSGSIDRLDREAARLRLLASTTAQEYRDGLLARNSIAGGLAPIDAAWRARRDQLLAIYDENNDLGQLRLDAEFAEGLLASIAAGLPERVALSANPVERGELLRLEGAVVSGVLDRGLAQINWDAEDEALAESAAGLSSDLRGQIESWRLGIVDSVAAAGVIRDGFEGWASASEFTAGSVIAEAAGQLRETAGDVPSWDRLLARVDDMVKIEAMSDVAELVTLCDARADLDSPIAFAAWGRASELAWPSSISELRSAVVIGDRLRDAAGSIGDASRNQDVLRSIDGDLSAAWVRNAELADSGGSFRDLAAMRGQLAIDPSMIPPEVATDLAVLDVVTRSEITDSLVPEIASGLMAVVKNDPSFSEDHAAILFAMASAEPPEEPSLDPQAVGPGAAGWRWVETQDPGILVYEGPPGAARTTRLSFVLIEDPEAGPFYIAEQELSIGVLLGLAEEDPAWVDGVMDEWEGADNRRGPRSWTRSVEGRVVLAETWLRDSIDEAEVYGNIERPSPPGFDDPLQRVGPAAAMAIAHRLGCRLPVSAEWSAAWRAAGSPSADTPGLNLRDRSWAVLRDRAAELLSERRLADWPDEGIFIPRDSDAPRREAATIRALQDETIWFAGTGEGSPSRGMVHLVGNVAEFVLMNSKEEAEAMTASEIGNRPERDVFERFLRDDVAVVGVIGGSAVSPPEVSIEQAFEVFGRRLTGGYADVGLRPIFTTEGARIEASMEDRLREFAAEVFSERRP